MANRVCEKCIHYDVCLLHEDNFIDDVAKNGFCGKFKNRADVVEVKHGHWKERWSDNYYHECSVCGKISKVSPRGKVYRFCPFCGAKMEGGVL